MRGDGTKLQPRAAEDAAADGTPSRRRSDLLHPKLLGEIGSLELIAREVIDGFLIGLHESARRGRSASFAENRLYNPGDDLRFVDWKVYGRSDRLYVKQFEEERNLRAYLVLDTSASMDWASDAERLPTKLDYAVMLTACLTLLLLRQSDAPGLVTFDDRIRKHHAPKALRSQGAAILDTLESVRGSGGTDAAAALEDVPARLRRRGLVAVISDLLVGSEETSRALRILRHRGHDVMVFHIIDPGERDLPTAGEAVYFDPESLDEVRANSGALRGMYRRAVEDALSEWRTRLARMGADYHLTSTDEPMGRVLRQFFDKRTRRR